MYIDFDELFRHFSSPRRVQEVLLHYARHRHPHKVTVLGNVFKTSFFPNHMMDLVYIWYNNRYRSKGFQTRSMTLRSRSQTLKILHKIFTTNFFQHNDLVWFIFCMMIDIGIELYSVIPTGHREIMPITLRSILRTLLLKFYIKVSNSSYILDYLKDKFIIGMIDVSPKLCSVIS